MSKLPAELRDLLAEGKHAHEPDSLRLNAVYMRVLHSAPTPSPYDLPPSASSPARPWRWYTVGGAVIVSATLWLARPGPAPLVARREPSVETLQAPVASPTLAARPRPVDEVRRSSARAEDLVAPLAHRSRDSIQVDPLAIPSSDWPVASPVVAERNVSRRIRRERREDAPPVDTALPAPVQSVATAPPGDAPSAAPSTPATPPAPTPAVASDADDVRSSRVVTRKAHPDAAASLRDEVQLITRARKALEQGDWHAAQRALDAHQLEHPVGQLHAERRALWARARCLAGDLAGARRIHAELLTLAPGSALLRSLERACPSVLR